MRQIITQGACLTKHAGSINQELALELLYMHLVPASDVTQSLTPMSVNVLKDSCGHCQQCFPPRNALKACYSCHILYHLRADHRDS